MTPTTYQTTMNDLNTILATANDPYKSIFDNCLSILTLYLSPFLLGSHYERVSTSLFDDIEKPDIDLCLLIAGNEKIRFSTREG